ncbi:MAG TPA: AI-2E family transporter [Bryobacteraceae bacterium]|nr:AI-2E family transporter [Bryobacteraceae bacterium]
MFDRTHLQQFFLVALAVAALTLCYVIIEPFLGPIVTATALAVLFYPVHIALLRRMPRKESLAAALSLLLVIALIVLPSIWLVSTVSRELTGLYSALKTRSDAGGGWAEWLTEYGSRPLIYFGLDPATAQDQLHTFLSERVGSISGGLLRLIQGILSNVAVFLFNGVIALFVLFFLLRDGDHLLERAREFLPLPSRVFDRLIAEVGKSVLANVYGVGAVAIVQGTLTGLLFFFTGVHSPVLWGVIAGFCSMIPVVGPPAVWVPVAVSFAITGSWGKAAVIAAFGAGVIGTADNVLRPWIVSGRVQLHPLFVFISLLGGAQAFGFLGLFIGPAALSVTIVILEVLKQGIPGRPGREQAVPDQNTLPGGPA